MWNSLLSNEEQTDFGDSLKILVDKIKNLSIGDQKLISGNNLSITEKNKVDELKKLFDERKDFY